MNAGRPVRVTAKLRSELQAARSARSARRKAEATAATTAPAAETKTTETKTETPRTRNRDWGFFGTCVSNGHQDAEAAWDEAMATLTNPHGRFALDPEDAKNLLDATWGRHLADDIIGLPIGPAINDLAADSRWMRATRGFVTRHINANAQFAAPLSREQEIAEIARQILKIETLESLNSDDQDFHNLATWTIAEALNAAYQAGKQSAGR
jgi:hypothetical protein